MTLQDVINCLFGQDRSPGEGPYPYRESDRDMIEVVFDTRDSKGLHLLSVYQGDDGKIHIDIGNEDE